MARLILVQFTFHKLKPLERTPRLSDDEVVDDDDDDDDDDYHDGAATATAAAAAAAAAAATAAAAADTAALLGQRILVRACACLCFPYARAGNDVR